MKDVTHLHQVGHKPTILKVYCTKDQLILAYAFSKFILNIISFYLFICISRMVSCNTINPSIIFLSGKNVVCDGLITSRAISVAIFIATLVKILKLTFNRHTGL
jgi:hypothetical protein